MPFLQIDTMTPYSSIGAFLGDKTFKWATISLFFICIGYNLYIHNLDYISLLYPEIQNIIALLALIIFIFSFQFGLKDVLTNRWTLEMSFTKIKSFIKKKIFKQYLYQSTHKLFAEELELPNIIKFNNSYRIGFEYIDTAPYNTSNFAHTFQSALLGLNPSFTIQFITTRSEDDLLDLEKIGLKFNSNLKLHIYKSYIIVHFYNPANLFNILLEVEGKLDLIQWKRLNNQELINLIK